jgi:DNA-binding transcriptional ArsR family regulator
MTLDQTMPLRLSLDAAPAYELVLSMAAPQGVGGAVDAALLDALHTLGHGSDLFWAHLLSVAVEAPPPRDVPAFLAHLSTADARDLRLRLAGYHVRWFRRLTPPETMVRALDGDRRAVAELLATSEPEDAAWQAALRVIVSTPAEELQRWVLELATRWAAAVGPLLERRQPALRREAARRRAEAARGDADALVEELAGCEYVPEPGVERMVLIPSAVIHPERHVFDHRQFKLVCYPVQLAEQTEWSPPDDVAAAFRALGDPTRLRLLHLLATEPLSAGRLAERLEMPLTTTLHHLTVLRRARIVRGGQRRAEPYAISSDAAGRLARAVTELLSPAAD